jgi:DNA-binding NarL/FixJ family response regulator
MRWMTRSILIVDDHPGFRRAAHALLDAEGFHVVGEAPDGATALEAVVRLRPDIVLLDIQLPDMDGFAVAQALVAEAARGAPGAPVVILVSSRDRGSYASQLDAADVAGFIPKSRLTAAAIRALTG